MVLESKDLPHLNTYRVKKAYPKHPSTSFTAVALKNLVRKGYIKKLSKVYLSVILTNVPNTL